jgi:gamma-glutamyl phosphate reductase
MDFVGKQAREAALYLQSLEAATKNRALAKISTLLVERKSDIFEANNLDLRVSHAGNSRGLTICIEWLIGG